MQYWIHLHDFQLAQFFYLFKRVSNNTVLFCEYIFNLISKIFFFFLQHSELKKVYMLEKFSFLKCCAVELLFQYVIDPADVSFRKKRVHSWFLGITAFF